MNSIKKVFLAISVVFMGIFLASCADSIEYKTVKIKVEQNGNPVLGVEVGSLIKIGNFKNAGEIEEYFSKNDLFEGVSNEERLELDPMKLYKNISCHGLTNVSGSILCKLITRIGTTNFSYKVIASMNYDPYGITDIDSESEDELVINLGKTPINGSELEKQGYMPVDKLPQGILFSGINVGGIGL